MSGREASVAAWGTTVRFLALGAAWGTSFLFMRVAVQGLSPGQVVLSRLALGGLVLNLLLVLMRRPWPRQRKLWMHLAVTGIIGCVVPFLLFAWAAGRIPSGLSSVLNAATPLATAAVTLAATRQEKVGLRRILGLCVGALGILLVLSPWRFYAGGGVDLWGQLACLVAVLCFGVAFSYTRKYVSPYGADPIAVPATQMLLATAAMLVLAPFVALGEMRLTAPVAASIILLGVVGTGLAYVWNFRIIAEWVPLPPRPSRT
ncbi:DMT family transporter [Arthrobacter ginkgonis]|uniref:DMT family transporter n=1 Tax=Arthrobacter ginkgonis TaxID=1630594 RepID=UPI0031EB48A2